MVTLVHRDGAAGSVGDLDLGGDTESSKPTRTRVKLNDGAADAAAGGAAGGQAVPRQRSNTGGAVFVAKTPTNAFRGRGATIGAGFSTPQGVSTFSRMATLSASTQKKVDPSNPILKAMTTFTDSEDLDDVLEAFARTKTLAGIEIEGGVGFFTEFKEKVIGQ